MATLCLLTLVAVSIIFTLAASSGHTPPSPRLPALNTGSKGHLPFGTNVTTFDTVKTIKLRSYGTDVRSAAQFEGKWKYWCWGTLNRELT